jgi:hypothetical protein
VKKIKGLLEAVPLVDFLGNRKEKERDIHNSLSQQAIQEKDDSDLFYGSGADPPTISDYQTVNQLTSTEMPRLITG